MKKERTVKIIIGAALMYVLLLIILTVAESRVPESSIHSLGDALWYSIITITTVGYGDMAPVTVLGKIIGVIFAFCSIGILTALISLGLNLIRGEALPRFYLKHSRGRNWYWFNEVNPDFEALAYAIHNEDPDGLVIFPRTETGARNAKWMLQIDAEFEDLLQIRGKQDGLSLFFMGDDHWKNAAQGARAASLGVPVYCLADCVEDSIPENLRLFSLSEVLGRSYWKKYPLQEKEKKVVLIGCGEAGSALLTRALLTNIYEKDRVIEYHVFGDVHGFASLHPEIVKALTPDNTEDDRLYFHEEEWTEEAGVIADADRVILCADDDQDNLNVYSQIRQWFAVQGVIHVRLHTAVQGINSFGSREESLTTEFVMKDAVNHMAILINDIYNENAETPVEWKDLSEFLRQSNIAAADHLPVKVRWLLGDNDSELDAKRCRQGYEAFCGLEPAQREVCREMEHRRWLRFYRMYNWKVSEKRDNMLRLHTSMLPYEQLSKEEHKKDDYAWEMLGRIAEKEASL